MKPARRVIAALMVAGSLSSLLAQWRDTLAPGISAFDLAHPEVPGDDPATLVETLQAVISAVGRDDSLGVLYSTPESTKLFVAFRLAYLLYPKQGAERKEYKGGSPAKPHRRGGQPRPSAPR